MRQDAALIEGFLRLSFYGSISFYMKKHAFGVKQWRGRIVATSESIVASLESASFVRELVRRIDQAYPDTLTSIAKAVATVAGGSPELISAMRNPLTRSGFLLGCAAEEIVSVSSLLEDKVERAFIRDVVHDLRPFAKPLAVRRIGPDLRRLLRDFKEHPNRMRVKSVRYMLQLNGLEELADKIDASQKCALAIECTVATDKIAGILWEQGSRETEETSARGRRRLSPNQSFFHPAC